ncbi:hypothetical protein CF392_11845, partial [Tamilnaduibacter salinus]
MNVEVIGDREFITSVQEQDGVWVLMAGQSLYALQAEGGRGLPVWSSAEKAEVFAENLDQNGLSPVFVPMSNFLSAAWLGSSGPQVVDVLASPSYGQESLTYTVEELRARLKTPGFNNE